MPFKPRNSNPLSDLAMILPYIIALMIAIGYFLLPIDLIPDFLIGIGQLDDVGVAGFAFFMAYLFSSAMTPSQGGR